MTLLTFDLGTHCGWCRCSDGNLDSGTFDLTPRRFDGGGMRYLRFRDRLGEVLPGIDRVAYEEVHRHAGTAAAHVYGGLLAVLQEECERRQIPYEGISVGTIKKLATGKGNADKAKMIAAANVKWGRDFTDDNEVDARFIAMVVLENLKAA